MISTQKEIHNGFSSALKTQKRARKSPSTS